MGLAHTGIGTGKRTGLVTAALVLALVTGCGGTEPVTATDAAPKTDVPSATEEPTPDETDAEPTGEPTVGTYPEFTPTDYTYTLRINCFCAGSGVPITVEVVDDRVVTATWARSGRGVRQGEPAGRFAERTIDDVVAAANDTDAARVDVVWPPGQDYPSSVAVDRSERIADEEVSYELSDVVVTATG